MPTPEERYQRAAYKTANFYIEAQTFTLDGRAHSVVFSVHARTNVQLEGKREFTGYAQPRHGWFTKEPSMGEAAQWAITNCVQRENAIREHQNLAQEAKELLHGLREVDLLVSDKP